MKAIMPKPLRRPRPRKKRRPLLPAAAQAVAQDALPMRGGPGHAAPDSSRNPAASTACSQNQPPSSSRCDLAKPPVETVPSAPPPKQSMEEKIRLLQEKFGRAR